MTDASITISGLSQWVVCASTPYSIEIFRPHDSEDWTVNAIDAVGKAAVWTGTAPDDALALVEAMTHIHALHAAPPLCAVV